MKTNKTKKLATFGLLVALAFILSYIEALIPIPFPVPGIKLGLANLVVVTAFYCMGNADAFTLSLIRILLAGITFGNLSTMIYSLAGGLLSWGMMYLFKRSDRFGIAGVSVIGGIAHNIGQIAVAMLIVENTNIVFLLPALMISGVAAGSLIGILGGLVVKRLRKVI